MTLWQWCCGVAEFVLAFIVVWRLTTPESFDSEPENVIEAYENLVTIDNTRNPPVATIWNRPPDVSWIEFER